MLGLAGILRHQGKNGRLVSWIGLASAGLIALVGVYHLAFSDAAGAATTGVYGTVAAGTVGAVGAVILARFGKSRARTAAGPTPGAVVAAPGWYADAHGDAALRYWDGVIWTDHIANPPAS